MALWWLRDESGAKLFDAIEQGNAGLIEAWVDSGKSVDFVTNDGYTPLTLAIAHGELDIARQLIRAGADLNEPRHGDGWTPLQVAVAQHPDLVSDLLDREIDVDFHKNRRALDYAVRTGDIERVRQLLDAGIPADGAGGDLIPPRQAAEARGWRKIVELLDQATDESN